LLLCKASHAINAKLLQALSTIVGPEAARHEDHVSRIPGFVDATLFDNTYLPTQMLVSSTKVKTDNESTERAT